MASPAEVAAVWELPQLLSIYEHVQWSRYPPAQIVLYGDYACPRTALWNAEIHQSLSKTSKDVIYIYRHCPARPFAQQAAECAVAASLQDAFWPMHELMLANQERLDDASLLEYALQLSLDANQLLRDLASMKPKSKVLRDIEAAALAGVLSAPAVFIQEHGVWKRCEETGLIWRLTE